MFQNRLVAETQKLQTLFGTLQAGRPYPLGAQADAKGINFAVFSSQASAIELCVYDASGQHETARYRLNECTNDIWHGYLPDAKPGLIYAWRCYGKWQPEHGLRFNSHKCLLDPYAREIVGHFEWRDEHLDHQRGNTMVMDERDNGPFALKARVPDDEFNWCDDAAPATPMDKTVLYELHLKGFSTLNPHLPPALRGTYAGLGHPSSIAYLKQLGVTAVSLLPVHFHLDEERLHGLQLSNYWGYNSLGFFCPSPRFAARQHGESVRNEFRNMVKNLHAQGIEVILDVVYNHTAESNEYGPSLSFKGLDNTSYYRRPSDSPGHYENFTGCGNTIDIRHPAVLRLVLDSLRFWVNDMHVDGFRFDLAPVLGRTTEGFNRNNAFFTAIAQDPILSRAKMIAEPWDVGPGGYQVGAFPRGWMEWNDHFRDAVRGFWLDRSRSAGELAQRLCGSADLFRHRWRSPHESINYVVSHDGFTLRDLVSYNERHNHANGENNRDGHGHNLSFNCGVEGETDDHHVNAARGRLQRALLACTLLSQGTPMLAAGDELGHSQGGNNNAYCHDSEISWINWSKADHELIAFTKNLIAVRQIVLPFGKLWYNGERHGESPLQDLNWLDRHGAVIKGEAWHQPETRVFACFIGRPGRTNHAQLILVNGSESACEFCLPDSEWRVLLNTAYADGKQYWQGSASFLLERCSVVLMEQL